MIVTSKRCFLNVLTQLWPADRLLNANYYIGDQRNVNGRANINDQVRINEYGQVETGGVVQTDSLFCSVFHVKLSTHLDPEIHNCLYVMGDQDTRTPEERFNEHLNAAETKISVYNFLFKDPLKGNGIQILMFNDDGNLLKFGHMICQYLSMNFGVDIVFIDPQYRPNCNGYVNYKGNKEYGIQLIRDLRDLNMVLDFNQEISASSYYNSANNIREYLMKYDFNETMYLYNLIFPNNPLPPGNYTLDHIREIIIANTTNSIKSPDINSSLSNLYVHDWEKYVNRYNQENEDFAIDDSDVY